MPDNRATKTETEADLEARVRSAIKIAFPWLPDGAIKHQIKFIVKFGHKNIEVDSRKGRNEAKLDILLEKDSVPFAILELKRPGIALTSKDGAQGLSYARLLEPAAPLVVITNGTDVTFLETHTGKPWLPTGKIAEEFKELVSKASLVAASDLRHAIDTLMGTSPIVWMAAVRTVSTDCIEELTASWEQPALPFTRDFLSPRSATVALIHRLKSGARMLVLEGPPLAGKSNVLRELHMSLLDDPAAAVLFLEAGTRHGAMQTLADALRRSLNWPVTAEEARNWLVRVSNFGSARLVLAFDGLQASDGASLKEIEDLSSATFGSSLSIVVAMDDTVSQRLMKAPNGRALSPIGRRAEVVVVGQLLDSEFSAARELLSQRRVFMMAGSEWAPEYRNPWVLRAMGSYAKYILKDLPGNKAVTLPPLLGLQLLNIIRKRFKGEAELRRRFRGLARAIVADNETGKRPADLVFQLLETGLVRRNAALAELEHNDLQWLIDYGFIRPEMHDIEGAIVLVRFPELLASELSYFLSEKILSRATVDPVVAADWLAGAASNLPLGELVAAQAIIDVSANGGELLPGIIQRLVDTPPSLQEMRPGHKYALSGWDGEKIEMHVEADNKGFLVIHGVRHAIDLEHEAPLIKNTTPWTILSHLATVPFEVVVDREPERYDPMLMLEIGTCPILLRSNGWGENIQMIPTADFSGISVPHHHAGVVEPITLAILNYLSQAGEENVVDWLAAASNSNSIALLTRVQTALHALISLQTHKRSLWAIKQLQEVIIPALPGAIAAATKLLDDHSS